ncbi:MAG: 50S ribosomal protein L6 [Saprospiraceae bacterium]|nr:50S ribosomal protein L6 [Saprospiraceae bacterium]
MSRVGKAQIDMPSGVNLEVSKSNVVKVKGPKGELVQPLDPSMKVELNDGILEIKRPTDSKRHKSLHGLSRALVANMVKGVSEGFKAEMELIGVGYRVSNTGNLLELIVGYSHPIYFDIPAELKVETKMEKGSNPTIILEGSDKQLLGQIAAKIRAFRKPEPYKGKGIRFVGEQVRRKAGKTAGK